MSVNQKVKKPFWKKWWFWVIVILFVIIVASSGDIWESILRGFSEGYSEGTAVLYAVSFAENAIGYDMEYEYGDLMINEVDENWYKVKGTIKREADGIYYNMQSQVEYMEEEDAWALRYLEIDGQLIRDFRHIEY